MNAINNTIAAQTITAGTIAATVKGMVNGYGAMTSGLKRKWHSLHAWFDCDRECSPLSDLRERLFSAGQFLAAHLTGRPVVAVVPQPVLVVDRRYAAERRRTGYRLLSLT